jgi:hypothetical protein
MRGMAAAARDGDGGAVDWDSRTSAQRCAATHEHGVGKTSFRWDLIFLLDKQRVRW